MTIRDFQEQSKTGEHRLVQAVLKLKESRPEDLKPMCSNWEPWANR